MELLSRWIAKTKTRPRSIARLKSVIFRFLRYLLPIQLASSQRSLYFPNADGTYNLLTLDTYTRN